MALVNLKTTLVLKDGTRLGPGEVEMDDEQARKRGLLKPSKAEAAPAASAPAKKPPALDPFDGLTEVQTQALKDAGFTGVRKLRKGLESGEVAAVAGIGPAAVEKLTANLGRG